MRQVLVFRPLLGLALGHREALPPTRRGEFDEIVVLAGTDGDFFEKRLAGLELLELKRDFVRFTLEGRKGEIVQPFLRRRR